MESSSFKAGLSLQYRKKLSDVFEKLLLCSIKLYIDIPPSMFLALSTCILFVVQIQSVNGGYFYKKILLFNLHYLHKDQWR